MKYKLLIIATPCFIASCGNSGDNDNENSNINPGPPLINYTVLNVYPHDTTAFTEGLLVHNGQLYESTGGQPSENNFRSWLAAVDLKTGEAMVEPPHVKMTGYNRSTTEPIRVVIFYVSDPDTPFLDPISH